MPQCGTQVSNIVPSNGCVSNEFYRTTFISSQIDYSEKYQDGKFEYRHVILPKDMKIPKKKGCLSEMEWRSLGVQQSKGWEHYANHRPEPHILLFRRPLGTVSIFPG